MTTKTSLTPEAEALADAILKTAGSGLRHYSMPKTREAIIAAAQHGISEARSELLAAITKAEDFIRGFEGDELQEGIDDLLAEIVVARAKALGTEPTAAA